MPDIETNDRLSPADIALRFRCTACGNCCRGEGYVFLDPPDIRRIAACLDLSIEDFKRQYTREDDSGRVILLDQDDPDKSCIFLSSDNLCRVHEAKPRQCRDFPHKWRPPNIATFCEGWRAACNLPPLNKKTGQHHP